MLAELQAAALRYYGVDWMVSLLVFIGLFCIGERKRAGFLLGAASSTFGLVFSMQIGSIANGLTSAVLFLLYLRGYWRFAKQDIETGLQQTTVLQQQTQEAN